MPFQSVPNVVQVEVRYLCNTRRIENILYFEPVEPYTVEYLEDLTEAVFNSWAANVMPPLSFDLNLVEVYAKGLTELVDLQALYVPGAPVLGGLGNPSLPNSVAACIAFKSGFTGRSSRGRIYVPGIPESGVVGDTFALSFINGLVADVEEAVGDVIASFVTTKHVIVSRYSEGSARPTGVTFDVTSYSSTDIQVDSRRSRVK